MRLSLALLAAIVIIGGTPTFAQVSPYSVRDHINFADTLAYMQQFEGQCEGGKNIVSLTCQIGMGHMIASGFKDGWYVEDQGFGDLLSALASATQDPCPGVEVELASPEGMTFSVQYHQARFETAQARGQLDAAKYALRAFLCEAMFTEAFRHESWGSNLGPLRLDQNYFRPIIQTEFGHSPAYDLDRFVADVLFPLQEALDKIPDIVHVGPGHPTERVLEREAQLSLLFQNAAKHSDNIGLAPSFARFLLEYHQWHESILQEASTHLN